MVIKIKASLILALVFVNFVLCAQNQEFGGSSVKIGWGAGFSMGNHTDGGGFVYSIGYQKETWKDRLRINPGFSIGHYSSKNILDARDQYFNSISVYTNFFYDVIKIKAFSLVAGCGGLVNNSRGLMGTGGDMDGYISSPHSEYLSDFHFGGYFGGGIRINSPFKRTAVNIMPFNFYFGNNYFAEVTAKIELDFKF